MNYPKVLIIGQPFNDDTGGGITMTNLFAGWDREKLAVACSGYLLSSKVDPQICRSYYQLGHKENYWIFPFSLIKRKYYSGPITLEREEAPTPAPEDHPMASLRQILIDRMLFPFLMYSGLIHLVVRTRLSEPFCGWLDEYEPDIIYGQASSLADIRLLRLVQAYLDKPLIFHMMDDWPSVISDSGPFKNYWTRIIDGEFRALLDQCTELLSISDFMSLEYKNRYGKEFKAFHNPVDPSFWKQHQRNSYQLGEKIEILYAGRIGLGIDKSLTTIAESIQKLGEEMRLPLTFVIQSGKAPDWINDYSCVEHRPLAPYEDLPRVFAEADLLVLPYDFSDQAIRYIKYSMPTKASEYMMCGTPIIVFAHPDTALVRYAEKYGWAELVTENGTAAFSRSLKKMLSDEHYRQAVAGRAKAMAEKNHRTDKVTEDFRTLMHSLTTQPLVY